MVFLAYSGDIAYSGKVDEYLEASSFCEELFEQFRSLSRPSTECLFVPGNHDCDFALETEVRKTLVASISSGRQTEIDQATVDQCTKIQDAFFSFLDAAPGQSNKSFDSRLTWTHTYGFDGQRVVFRCINTSWITQLREKQGALAIPDIIIDDLSSSTGDLNIVLMHHPATWFATENYRKVRAVLQGNVDFVLMGHEHIPEASARITPKEDTTWYIDGGVLQDSDDAGKSSFSSVLITQEEGTLQARTWQHTWNGATYCSIEVSEKPTLLRQARKHRPTGIIPAQATTDFIQDIGSSIRHPAVDKLRHSDLFVYPDLSCFSLDPAKRHSYEKATVPSEEILEINKDSKFRIIVLGAQKSGRTFLLKQCFSISLDQGLLPVWIDGEKISTTKDMEISKLVDREMRRQYHCDNPDLLAQHSNSEKVITACRVIQIDSLLGVQWAAKLCRAIFCSVRLVSVPRWCSASLVTLRLVFR